MGNSATAPEAAGANGTAYSHGQVQLAATEIIRVAGVAAYHTSVLVGSREYYFDSKGIASGPSLFSHMLGRPSGLKMEVRPIGSTTQSGSAMFQALSQFFSKGSYDVLHKNCNAFTDAALYYLTGERLEARYSRAERLLLAAEPFSTVVLNQLLKAAAEASASQNAEQGKATRAPSTWSGYSANPMSKGFSVEDVVAAISISGEDEKTARAQAASSSYFGLGASCCCALAVQSRNAELVPFAAQAQLPATGSVPRVEL